MIHKYYRPDGKPDWNRWLMECDGCHHSAQLLGHENPEWLVSACPEMNIYCPDCFNGWADQPITSALRCPDCDRIDLRLWPLDLDAPPDQQHPGLVDCAHCGAIIFLVESPSWFPPDPDSNSDGEQ